MILRWAVTTWYCWTNWIKGQMEGYLILDFSKGNCNIDNQYESDLLPCFKFKMRPVLNTCYVKKNTFATVCKEHEK
jgi:hypothetical protein